MIDQGKSTALIGYDGSMQANLARVFGERDAAMRIEAIRELYAEDAVLHEPPMLRTQNRYREIVVSADGRTLYVATDPAHLGTTEAGNAAFKLETPGAILAFRFIGKP